MKLTNFRAFLFLSENTEGRLFPNSNYLKVNKLQAGLRNSSNLGGCYAYILNDTDIYKKDRFKF
jgi:hypothetical protein